MEKDQRHQSHGLTAAEMRDLQYKQIHEPDSIEMIPANNAGEKITDPYFKEAYAGYEIPAHERHIYHVAAEARTFKTSGAVAERSSVMTVHKLTKEAYEFQKKHKAFEGQIVHILHNPELEAKQAPRKPQAPKKTEVTGEDLTLLTAKELKERIEKVTNIPVPANLRKKEDLIAELKRVTA